MSTGFVGPGQYADVTSSVVRLLVSPTTSSSDRSGRDEGEGAAVLGEHAAVQPSALDAPTGLSFDVLYEEHFEFVWRMARRLGVPEAAADDVVQDTFVVLHRRLPEYDGVTPARSWLIGILHRVVSDHRRRYRRKEAACVPHPEESERAIVSLEPAPSAEAEQAEEIRLLHGLLSELEPSKREVLVLAQLEELSVPEISALLGANVNAIYARLRAARRDFDAIYARHRARTAHKEGKLR